MRLVRNGSLCLEERSSLEKVFVVNLSEGSMDSGPAPSRATPSRRFGPRDLARLTRARLPGTARRNVSLFFRPAPAPPPSAPPRPLPHAPLPHPPPPPA